MNKIVIVQGLQWGSEAKGNIASLVAHNWEPDTVVSAWQPNAGHTAYIGDHKYVHTMLAVGALAPTVQNILIGPGSVVDLEQLRKEIEYAYTLNTRALLGKNLTIHPQATILRPHHREQEKGLVAIGSTMKGSMAAVAEKMLRAPGGAITARQFPSVALGDELGDALDKAGMTLAITEKHYDKAIDISRRMLVEGAQGFSLGIHTGFYPYTTSRDVSTAQLFADCRLPFPRDVHDVHVIGVFRTYPIRVANRFNEHNEQIGTSGGCYFDQKELDWKRDLGREPELTTVTKLPRRIFTFSQQQLNEACRIVRPDSLAMTFCDYVADDPYNHEHFKFDVTDIPEGLVKYMGPEIMGLQDRTPIKLLSFGPKSDNIHQVYIRKRAQMLRGTNLGFLP